MDLPIRVKTLGHKDLYFHINNQLETASDLHSVIGSRLQWYPEDFQLIHDGQDLSDSKMTLADLLYHHEFINAQSNSLTIWALLRSTTKRQISLNIENFTDKKMSQTSIKVPASSTVHNVKQMLVENSRHIKLIVAGKVLDDSDTIGEYTSDTVSKVLLMNQQDTQSEINIKIMLVGGGHFTTTIQRHESVDSVKTLVLRSGVFSHFRSKFELYDAASRILLKAEHKVETYNLGTDVTLLAVPSLDVLSQSIPGRFGRQLSAFSILPTAVDIFFPTNTSQKKRIVHKKDTGALFGSLRRGFFSDSSKYKVKLKQNHRLTLDSSRKDKEKFGRYIKKALGNQEKEVANSSASKCCDECSRKLAPGMEIAGKCRCGKVLCGLHIHTGDHECLFDFKQHEKQDLERMNQRISPVKVSQI